MVSREQRTAAIESGYKLDKEGHAQSHKQGRARPLDLGAGE
jgi:hypothetical protein